MNISYIELYRSKYSTVKTYRSMKFLPLSCRESDNEQEVFIRPPQAHTSMYVPYIEGPKINWTVDDSLYNRFFKWKIKCENILECELAMLLEARKCKKVVAWSGDFGIDQYISWDLAPEETCLEVI